MDLKGDMDVWVPGITMEYIYIHTLYMYVHTIYIYMYIYICIYIDVPFCQIHLFILVYLNSLLSTSAPENCQMCQETDGWKRLPQGLAANRWHLALAEDEVFHGSFHGKMHCETDASMGN